MPKTMTVADRLKREGAKINQARKKPLWKGPEVDGVTFSMLSRFLCCRERFRLRVMEGLTTAPKFNHLIEYGQMWHVCEEALAAEESWQSELKKYCLKLTQTYRTQQEQINHWYAVCCRQFPEYVKYWEYHPDVKGRTPLLQEQVFDVPYELPSGRVVRLRGKWDSVDLIGKGKPAGIYLQENKTKGDIKPEQLQRQLKFDLQTMLYLVALTEYHKNQMVVSNSDFWREHQHLDPSSIDHPILGVRYNVVRRPLSGGKGSIKRKKGTKNKPPETKQEFYDRVAKYIQDNPEQYFMRWKVEISTEDIERFKTQCLNPILEQLCDWWEYAAQKADPFDSSQFPNRNHWVHPFGVYNSLNEGRSTDLDDYMMDGNEVGLVRVDELFGELKGDE